jgi:cytochrome c-type biogenesis protein
MPLIFISFIAGILTVAAPCILPLLPVVIGRSVLTSSGTKLNPLRPYIIIAALGFSVILFTLLLKASTELLSIPQEVWQIVSGSIIGIFGVFLIWPNGWEQISSKLNLTGRSNMLMTASRKHSGAAGDVLLGFSLGPIFNSCSPTYLLIVAIMLGGSFTEGLAYLLSYTLGLTLTLLLVALLGQRVVAKLGWLANPNGLFKKIIGFILILLALSLMFGLDKRLQQFVIDQGWYAPVSDIELRLRN